MTETKRCPHCGSHEVAEIMYGLPDPEALEAEERAGVVFGGCIVSGEDPTHECRSCGSVWASSQEAKTSPITDVFAEIFEHWDIHLPRGAEAAGCRGTIYKAGWHIRYRFGDDGSPGSPDSSCRSQSGCEVAASRSEPRRRGEGAA